MIKLSTGDDSTLGNYRKLAVSFFGEKNKAIEMLDTKIAQSPNKENEEVLTDERQMIQLLGSLAFS